MFDGGGYRLGCRGGPPAASAVLLRSVLLHALLCTSLRAGVCSRLLRTRRDLLRAGQLRDRAGDGDPAVGMLRVGLAGEGDCDRRENRDARREAHVGPPLTLVPASLPCGVCAARGPTRQRETRVAIRRGDTIGRPLNVGVKVGSTSPVVAFTLRIVPTPPSPWAMNTVSASAVVSAAAAA
jgi:hypothetical protein